MYERRTVWHHFSLAHYTGSNTSFFSEFVRAATGKVNWFGFPITCYSNIKTILQ